MLNTKHSHPVERRLTVSRSPGRAVRRVVEALELRRLLAVTVSATLRDSLLTDVDGDTRFDPGDTIQYTAVVANTGDADATGVSFSDLLDGQTTLGTVKVSPLATRDTFSAVGNTPLSMTAANGLRANDIDIDGVTPQNSLVVAAGTFATAAGGSVTVAADGSFTYTPQTGDQNQADTFAYTITDADGLASTGRATINLGERVWYVDPAAPTAGADGSFAHPFTSLTPLNNSASDADDSSDTIFVYERGIDLTGGIVLESGEQLIGDGFAFTANGLNVGATNTNPKITNSGGNAITLAEGNTIKGVTVGTSSGGGIVGSGINLVTVDSTVLIANVAGNDFDLTGGNGTVSFAASITNTSGHSVSIVNRTGGTTTISGAVSDTGTGILLNNNAGATINFTGGLNLNTGANVAFAATNVGTVSATQNNTTILNTINTTTGTGLAVTGTTIGAAGLTFRSISVNGAAKGIVLNNTGAGGLTVTGTGTTDASGGTIQNISVRGIELISAANISLSNIALTNANNTNGTSLDLDISAANGAIYMSSVSTAAFTNVDVSGTTVDNGITGLNVSNFSLTNSTITLAGNAANESGIEFSNLSGTCSITGSDISFSETNSLDIVNTDVNLTLTINATSFRDTQTVSPGGAANSIGEGGFQFRSFSTNVAFVPVSNLLLKNSSFLRLRTQGIQAIGQNDSVVNIDITGNTINSGSDIGAGIDINGNDTASVNFNVINNPLIHSQGADGVNITSFLGATVQGRVSDNPNINIASIGAGVRVVAQETSHTTIEIKHNAISMNVGNNSSAITGQARFQSARLDITIDNNTTTVNSTAIDDIDLIAGSSAANETNQVYANIKNNHVSNGATNVLRLRVTDLDATSSPKLFLQGFVEGGAGLDDDAVATWNANANLPTATTANINVSLTGAPGNAAAPSAGAATLPGNPLPAPLLAAPVTISTSEKPKPGASSPRAANPARSTVPTPNSDSERRLLPSDLTTLVEAARARWSDAGLTPAQMATLQRLDFQVDDLPGWYLGEAAAGRVTLDVNAGGNGWFIDQTPMTDNDVPAGKIDLLTTVMHEMGHQLGLEDSYLPADRKSLMYGYLTLGERRLPAMHLASGADLHMLQGAAGPDFLFAPINIGTLSYGTSITIKFNATISNPLVGAGTVSTQGTISGTNFASVVTDDPDVGGTQATVTVIQPAAPSAPDLQLASDSGSSGTDNVTNAASPIFDVTTADSAATIELFRDGALITSRTGPGALTDANPIAGVHVYKVRQRFGAGGINSDDSATLSVTIDRTAPAAPGAADLQAASDAGASNTDNITNVNSPTFDTTTGIEAGATVALFRDGTSVATRTGAGAIQSTTTADGGHAFSLRQTDVAGNQSAASADLNVAIDTVAPTMTGTPVFQFETGLSILYSFNELLTSTFSVGSVAVQNLGTLAFVAAASKNVSFLNTDIRLGFPALLPDGNYRATIAAGTLTDTAGNAFAAGSTLDFFVLAGDFNRNRTVDFDDLVTLAQNYNLSSKTFSFGDANYDGVVNFDDLVILAQNYNHTLAITAAPLTAPRPAARRKSPVDSVDL